MGIEVKIPTILRTYTGGEKTVEAKGATLAALIDDLDGGHPGLKGRLITEEGALHRFVNVYVNDPDARLHDPRTDLWQHGHLACDGGQAAGLRPGLRDAREHVDRAASAARDVRRAHHLLAGRRRLEPGGRHREAARPAVSRLGDAL